MSIADTLNSSIDSLQQNKENEWRSRDLGKHADSLDHLYQTNFFDFQ